MNIKLATTKRRAYYLAIIMYSIKDRILLLWSSPSPIRDHYSTSFSLTSQNITILLIHEDISDTINFAYSPWWGTQHLFTSSSFTDLYPIFQQHMQIVLGVTEDKKSTWPHPSSHPLTAPTNLLPFPSGQT